ncbi:hypothetical protein DFJ77DRAFT_473242 [Powellomyces hirtus]|nr:hypothetical protein DFJ77DRAFT_473242 [Powellomyces hirtus]
MVGLEPGIATAPVASSGTTPAAAEVLSESQQPTDSDEDWLEDAYEKYMPPRIKERTSGVYDNYLNQRSSSTTEIFVLVCGRPGAGKTTLINEVIEQKDLLKTSASRQTESHICTRVRRGPPNQKFSWRMVLKNPDQWEHSQNEAVKRLRDEIEAHPNEVLEAAESSDTARAESSQPPAEAALTSAQQREAVAAFLSEPQSLDVLKATYPNLNVTCLDVLKLLETSVKGIFGSAADCSSWTKEAAIDILQNAVNNSSKTTPQDHGLPNHLADFQGGVDQRITDLTLEQVRFLSSELSQSHTSKLEVAQYLLVRHLLIDISATTETCESAWRQVCDHLRETRELKPSQHPKALKDGNSAFRVARELARHLDTQGQKLLLPMHFFDLWPIIEFVEIAGPVTLPERVVLVDSPGSQDTQHLVDPLHAALDSLPRPPMVWLTSSLARSATDATLMTQLASLARSVGWHKLEIIFTRCDMGEPSELGAQGSNIEAMRTRVYQKLLSSRAKDAEVVAQQLAIRETSADFHRAAQSSSKDAFKNQLRERERNKWSWDDETLESQDFEELKKDVLERGGIHPLRDDLQQIIVEDRRKAEQFRKQHAERLLLHLDAAIHPGLTSEADESDDESVDPASSISSDRHLRAHVRACERVSSDMSGWGEAVSRLKASHSHVGALSPEELSAVHASISTRLMLETLDVYSPLQDAHHSHFRCLMKRHGRWTAKGGRTHYDVAYLVGSLFEDCIALEQRVKPYREALCELIDTHLRQFALSVEKGLEGLDLQGMHHSSADIITVRTKQLRAFLQNEISALQESSASCCPSIPHFAKELWWDSLNREEWNQMWEGAEPQTGPTDVKKAALVADLANRAPKVLQRVLDRVLNQHLLKLTDNAFDYVKTGVLGVCERLLQAMRPLALDAAEATQVARFRDVVRHLLKDQPAAPPSSSIKRKADVHPTTRPKQVRLENGCAPVEAQFVFADGAGSTAEVTADATLPWAATSRQLRPPPDSSSVAVTPVAMAATSVDMEDGDPTMYQDADGNFYCVFFRGRCATKPADVFRDQRDGLSTALVRPIEEVFREPAYQSVSSFVAVEDMLRAQDDAQYRGKPIWDRVKELALDCRKDMVSGSQRTFETLAESLQVSPADCSSNSLAFYSTNRDFDNFRFATQQLYSNNEVSHMKTYASAAADISRFASPSCEPNVAAFVDRPAVLAARASNSNRRKYLQFEAWAWMGNPRYVLPRHGLASSLHGNPNVSITDNVEHALRYTVGSKKYMQGKHQQPPRELRYGWNAATRQYIASSWRKLPDEDVTDPPRMIGQVLLFMIPREEYVASLADGSCNNVTRLHKDSKINIGYRIRSEREVTFAASVPPESMQYCWEMPMLNLDDEEGWRRYYGVVKTDPAFRDLETRVEELVKARAQNESATTTQNKEDCVRKALAACMRIKLESTFERELQGRFPGIRLPSRVNNGSS